MTLRAKLLWIIVPATLLISAAIGWLLVSHEGAREALLTQAANRSLAANLVMANILYTEGRLDAAALDDLFETLMIVNPAIEVYLLNRDGGVYMHSASDGEPVAGTVDLRPVRAFLEPDARLPIRGSNPRSLDRTALFSAAPVDVDGESFGYLYVVLGDPHADAQAGVWLQTLGVIALVVGGIVMLALIIAAAVVRLITQPIERLDDAVARFRRQLANPNSVRPIAAPAAGPGGPDEIDSVAQQTAQMSRTIVHQLGKLAATDQLRRQLVANVSHDLRTPLSAVEGYLQTVLVKGARLDGVTVRQYVETAYRSARRLGGLIEELFELSRLEADDRQLSVENFCIAELASDVIQKLGLLAEKRGVRLEMSVEPEASHARGELGLIERVLDNLMVNAIQHSPSGGCVWITLEARRRGIVRVTVRDEGSGIAEEDLPFVFDRFFRPNTSGVQQTPGAGLGLAIVRRIMKLHRSRVVVRSQLGQGSALTFWLPPPTRG